MTGPKKRDELLSEEVARSFGFRTASVLKWVLQREDASRELDAESVWQPEPGHSHARRKVASYPRRIEPSLALFRLVCEAARGGRNNFKLYLILHESDSPRGHLVPRSYLAIRKELSYSPPYVVGWSAGEAEPVQPAFSLEFTKDLSIWLPTEAARICEVKVLPVRFERYRVAGESSLQRYITVADSAVAP